MAIVVKWRKTGEYLSGFYFSRKGPRLAWHKKQSEAMLFQDIGGAKDCVRGHLGRWGFSSWQAYFVRIVPRKRHDSPRSVSEPAGCVRDEAWESEMDRMDRPAAACWA